MKLKIAPIHNYNKGFLLFEVMITFLLISIVLVALAKFQVTTLQDNSLAKARSVAVNLAQNKIEALRNLIDNASYLAITGGSDSVGPPGSNATTILTGLNTVYTCTWSVSYGIAQDNIQMEVVVSWPDKKGTESHDTTIILSSIISNITAINTGRLF